jgi:hypothetical protein
MIVSVKQLIGNTLNTRDEAQKLFTQLVAHNGHTSRVTLNFTDVDFMSRSFADEFYKLKIKRNIDNNKDDINIENANLQIIDILNAVARTQKSRELKDPGRISLSFTDRQQFSDYLQSL